MKPLLTFQFQEEKLLQTDLTGTVRGEATTDPYTNLQQLKSEPDSVLIFTSSLQKSIRLLSTVLKELLIIQFPARLG